MINTIIAGLPQAYSNKVFSRKTSFYLSVGNVKKTITFDSGHCTVEDGKTLENADCVCKTSEEFFVRIWDAGYKPGMGDFLSGAIKSNAPQLLQQFMKAFAK